MEVECITAKQRVFFVLETRVATTTYSFHRGVTVEENPEENRPIDLPSVYSSETNQRAREREREGKGKERGRNTAKQERVQRDGPHIRRFAISLYVCAGGRPKL